MEIGEFRKQFMEQLRFDAEHEGSAPEAQFISRALELLEEEMFLILCLCPSK